MKETINVVSVTPKKQGAKNGKAWTISEIATADGRTFDSFDFFTVGETVEVDVTPNANPAYNANIKKGSKKSDWQNAKQAQVATQVLNNNNDKEQRITMLSCISSACNYYAQRGQVNEEQVIELAKKFFNLAMNNKQDDLPF